MKKFWEMRDRLNKKRRLRLLSKMQKANVLDRAEDILILPSWNKRFKQTAKMRAVRKTIIEMNAECMVK